MARTLRFALASLVLFGAAACSRRPDCTLFAADGDRSSAEGSDGRAPTGSFNGAPEASPAAARAIAEADIVQLDDEQDRIYAMSKNRTLAIVDARTPGTLSLMGKTTLAGEPFEMYRRGDVLLTMSNRAVRGDGGLQEPQPEDAAPSAPDATASAAIVAVDVSNPAAASTTASFKVAGEIADSRIVGNVLYLATYENAACWGCGTNPRTLRRTCTRTT